MQLKVEFVGRGVFNNAKNIFTAFNKSANFRRVRHFSMQGRTLQIFRDGRRSVAKQTIQLPPGAQGNVQTLSEMAKIVREDFTQHDLKNFVMREIIGLEKRTMSEKTNAAFEFCRDEIIYDPEKDGFETVADLWSCCYALNDKHASGDCSIKVVALATCLSFLGLKPVFVALGQVPKVDYFNHVYLGIYSHKKLVAFDPTPKQFRVGDEAKGLRRLVYPIFK